MNKKINPFILSVLILFAWQCTEVKDYTDQGTDSTPPAAVTNPEVININGGAVIKYQLPADNDLMAVKALYSFTEGGEVLEAYSSAFTDSITVIGFPDTQARKVQLICVDKNKNESSTVEVTINPLTPPVELIRQTLTAAAVFGGVYTSWKNPTGADVGVSLFAEDSIGNMNLDYTYYTNAKEGSYSFRGFDDTKRTFRVQVRDRWNNYSSVLDTVLQPLYEMAIPPRINGIPFWKRYGWDDGSCKWRGDATKQNVASEGFDAAIDGNPATFLHLARPGNMLIDYTDNPADAETHLVPIYLTIDLGRSCMLSRHKLWHRTSTVLRDNNAKKYEIWATNETPKAQLDFSDIQESLAYWTSWEEVSGTDAWKTDWTHIANCETIPPSGATQLVDVTENDKTWALANGFEFDIFPEYTGAPFRYVRIVSQRNWSEGTILHFGEFNFWGAYAD